MPLYTKKQLQVERSKGLVLSDKENKHWNDTGSSVEWTNEEFEKWLNTKSWDKDVKDHHRERFKGTIIFTTTGFTYPN